MVKFNIIYIYIMDTKTKKKIASYLFLTATVLAIMSGASEIVAVKDRADKGETQNIITPAIIAVTKFIGIPKLYYLAVDAQVKGFSFFHSSMLPVYSRTGAVAIWLTAVILAVKGDRKNKSS